MGSILRIALEGAFTNFKRIFFAADRVTDMEMRGQRDYNKIVLGYETIKWKKGEKVI